MSVSGLLIFGLSLFFSYILLSKNFINLYLVIFSYILYLLIMKQMLFNWYTTSAKNTYLFNYLGFGVILWLTCVIGTLLGMKYKKIKSKIG